MTEPLTDDRLAELTALADSGAEAPRWQDVLLLLATIAELRTQLATAERQARDLEARYVGTEPTVREELDYLIRCRDAVLDLCDAAEKRGVASGGPFTVAAVRAAAEGMAEVGDPDDVAGVPA